MIVETPGSQMGSPAAAEEGGEEVGGGRWESGQRVNAIVDHHPFYIYWFVHTSWFLDVSINVFSWSSLTRYIENTAARS